MARPTSLGRVYIPRVDVERLHNRALRLYLRRELRDLEKRIDYLSESLPPERQQHLGRGLRLGGVTLPSEEDWDQLLELEYLEAMREALLETLNAL